MNLDASEPPFELRALEIFLAVCQAGGMAAAARSLRITQPAVSQAIAELERRFGTVLFDRAVRPLALTPAGGLLRQRASALINDAREIPVLLRQAAHGRLAHLRVGLVDSLGRALSVEVARWLSGRADQVSVFSGLTSAHASALLTRQADMLIGVDDLQEYPGLERVELIREPYVLLLSKSIAAPRSIAELKALAAKLALVRFSARSQTGIDLERHMRRIGLSAPHQVEFDSPYGVTASVAAGGAFAITTPLCTFEAQLAPGKVRICPLPGPALSRTLTLVARHRELGTLPRDLAAGTTPILQRLLQQMPLSRNPRT